FNATVPSRGKLVIRLRAELADDFTGELTNIASAVFDNDPADTVTTTVRLPASLNITKTGPEAAEAGEQISYDIEVSNTGPGSSGEVLISDRLPLGSVYIESDGGFYNET